MAQILGGAVTPVPPRAERDNPLQPPDFEAQPHECPDCGADTDPWTGENIVGLNLDMTVLDGGLVIIGEMECTCGWSDRVILGD